MTEASYVDAGNRFHLRLRDIINYNDIISAADTCESVKGEHFTDMQIVKNTAV